MPLPGGSAGRGQDGYRALPSGSGSTPTEAPRVEIDLNVRIGQTLTFAGFEDVYGYDLETLYLDMPIPVTVYEPESGVSGMAKIVGIDYGKRLVYLELKWRKLA